MVRNMDNSRMIEFIQRQSESCRRLGSPLYAQLLARVADDVLSEGPAARVLVGHQDDPGPSALALRLMGTAHRLALAGAAPDLAAHYPSCDGDGDVDAAWPALRALFADQPDLLREGLSTAPQTNEVGRAAGLFGALLYISDPDPLPVRLWEIGASAGLNLRADKFRYIAAAGPVWGPMSPVELDPAWDVAPAGAPRALQITERVGGDVAPIDPADDAGALRLTSYVWPDQLARLRRLRGAIEIARQHQARVIRCGAGDLLDGLELVADTLTVVWHSVMWQYLPADEQHRVLQRLQTLGAAATRRKPLAHIAFEPRRVVDRRPFCVTARTWPGGQERVVGQAPPHGVPVVWSRTVTA